MPFEDYYIDGDDLGFESAGAFQGVEGSARVAQAAKIRLDTALGEWLFNTANGVDYFGIILIKGADITEIRADLVFQLQDVNGLKRVTDMTLTIEEDRLLFVSWTAVTDDNIEIGGILP